MLHALSSSMLLAVYSQLRYLKHPFLFKRLLFGNFLHEYDLIKKFLFHFMSMSVYLLVCLCTTGTGVGESVSHYVGARN